ncbi:hypothetical protein [Halarcobacter ebronensis]|uniref:Uncharacterized protein n=1 Tax=Halarcobacter ebronensis TaxID=1462615 RepID=A0A4V1M0R7_9BACT|nr:hypothetical protein [Halarcobacter ebronensis]QKF82346.1 putative membrane protein [Halarcobacter ebronensis]RXK07625.1 hypothetical protein CRV07_03960 [Halarcobacter ebronensis]
MNKPIFLFPTTFIIIIATYLFVFGEIKTLEIIKGEYLSIFALILITSIFFIFKFKLKDYEIIEFIPINNSSLKSLIIFFLIFEVIDFYSEDGFIGMIKLWFLYWVMGLIALILMQTLNYYKNYKLLQRIEK